MDVSVGNCESALLSTNMEFVGGDNGGNCINELYDQCNKAKNGGNCENYNSACSKSTNMTRLDLIKIRQGALILLYKIFFA